MSRRDFLFYGEDPTAVIHLRPAEDEYSAIVPLDRPDHVEAEVDRVLTQYRESGNLLSLIRTYVGQVDKAALVLESLIDFFDLDFAVGDQLTIIGESMGWPRYHKYGARRAVFGFAKGCDDCYDGPPLAGFCNGVWDGCEGTEFQPYTFADDDLYRRFIKSRIVQLYGDYRRDTLTEAARALFDEDRAFIVRDGSGRITLSLGRPFADEERAILHLFRQVLPIAPGIQLQIKPQPATGVAFGFGEGWSGWCTGVWL